MLDGVWGVFFNDFEGSFLMGIFDSEEKANEFKQKAGDTHGVIHGDDVEVVFLLMNEAC